MNQKRPQGGETEHAKGLMHVRVYDLKSLQ